MMPHCWKYSARALGVVLYIALLAASSVAQNGSEQTGKEAFEKRCAGCHSLDADKVGPRLRGVYGRTAGRVKLFKYSDAVRNAHVTWDSTSLDKWLSDTETIIADNDMPFRMSNSEERAAIIEYLRSLSAK